MTHSVPNNKLLKPLALAAVIFLTVSGGPYGLEPLLQFAGQHGALLLLMLVPLLWDVPTIFMVLELNSMMPVDGGYYKWVNRAMGRRFAFYEGWWTWLYSFADMAIYPVLFVTYLSFFFPEIVPYKIPVCLMIIWSCAGLNILGIVPVGRASLLLSAAVLIPFLLLFGLAFVNHSFTYSVPSLSLSGIGFAPLGMAIYTVMWNFLGWDNTTTYAGEVSHPVRSYLKSIGIAFTVVMVVYLITTFITQNSGIDFKKLNNEGYPLLGTLIAGKWLGALLSLGGMASTLGIFSAVLLSISRIPKAMADDKLLPLWFSRTHPKFNTPYISVIICATVVSGMVCFSFTELIVIDVILYGAGLFLEYISLIILRMKEPTAERPFKIPLKTGSLWILTLLPMGVYLIALAAACMQSEKSLYLVLFAGAGLLSALPAYRILKFKSRL